MKNLENFKVKELNTIEMRIENGGTKIDYEIKKIIDSL